MAKRKPSRRTVKQHWKLAASNLRLLLCHTSGAEGLGQFRRVYIGNTEYIWNVLSDNIIASFKQTEDTLFTRYRPASHYANVIANAAPRIAKNRSLPKCIVLPSENVGRRHRRVMRNLPYASDRQSFIDLLNQKSGSNVIFYDNLMTDAEKQTHHRKIKLSHMIEKIENDMHRNKSEWENIQYVIGTLPGSTTDTNKIKARMSELSKEHKNLRENATQLRNLREDCNNYDEVEFGEEIAPYEQGLGAYRRRRYVTSQDLQALRNSNRLQNRAVSIGYDFNSDIDGRILRARASRLFSANVSPFNTTDFDGSIEN